jgi:serine/threonine protein kinase
MNYSTSSTSDNTFVNNTPDFPWGKVLSDPSGSRYRLLEKLGSGSFATVYKAKKDQDSRMYAIKAMNRTNVDEETLESHRAEAKIQMDLDHPNIVKAYSAFFDENYSYIIMEYCPGMELFDYITEQASLFKRSDPNYEAKKLKAIMPIFLQILDAVEYMHSKNVYHRDLKPENVILLPDGTVKVTDFGLAVRKDICDTFGWGSPSYMSFESHSDSLDYYSTELSDIWTLCILFLVLMYHRLPWASPTSDCDEFVDFQKFGSDVLVYQLKCSYEIADFCSAELLCPEYRRTSISYFRNWLLDRMDSVPSAIDIPAASANFEDSYGFMSITPENTPPLMFDDHNESFKQEYANVDSEDEHDDDEDRDIFDQDDFMNHEHGAIFEMSLDDSDDYPQQPTKHSQSSFHKSNESVNTSLNVSSNLREPYYIQQQRGEYRY